MKVKDIPTFTWFDVIAKTGDLGKYLADADSIYRRTGRKQIVQIVVYDLPDRDCAAAASNGEFSIADGGVAKYRNYVDLLVAEVRSKSLNLQVLSVIVITRPLEYPTVRVIAVVEPDSLANLVTNMNVTKCRGAETAYKVKPRKYGPVGRIAHFVCRRVLYTLSGNSAKSEFTLTSMLATPDGSDGPPT